MFQKIVKKVAPTNGFPKLGHQKIESPCEFVKKVKNVIRKNVRNVIRKTISPAYFRNLLKHGVDINIL